MCVTGYYVNKMYLPFARAGGPGPEMNMQTQTTHFPILPRSGLHSWLPLLPIWELYITPANTRITVIVQIINNLTYITISPPLALTILVLQRNSNIICASITLLLYWFEFVILFICFIRNTVFDITVGKIKLWVEDRTRKSIFIWLHFTDNSIKLPCLITM